MPSFSVYLRVDRRACTTREWYGARVFRNRVLGQLVSFHQRRRRAASSTFSCCTTAFKLAITPATCCRTKSGLQAFLATRAFPSDIIGFWLCNRLPAAGRLSLFACLAAAHP